LLVRGEWPVGIIGLIAGRLAEDFGRAAVVATTLDAEAGTLRASCRSGGAMNLAEALIACERPADPPRRPRGRRRLRHRRGSLAGVRGSVPRDRGGEVRPQGPPELTVDLVLPADSVDYDARS
jgi:hypothetical protein